jgi:hypothetical protein
MSDPRSTAFKEEADMAQFDPKTQAIVGAGGLIEVRPDDEVTRKLAMLIEGECEGLGPLLAAKKFGFSKQRYFQLRAAFAAKGAAAWQSLKRGPKTQYRRTAEVVQQVIRYRFLDADASPQVIAQKLCQSGWQISLRSVQRVLKDYGLQKKTLPVPADPQLDHRNAANAQSHPRRTVRSGKRGTRRSTTPRR